MWLLPPPPCKEDTSEWIWPRVFLFFLLWWTFYWAILRISHREPEYCCRLITLAHGIITVYFTYKDITVTKQEFDFFCNTPLTPYQLYILSVTISYFLYDFVWINIFGNESLTIHLHHICSIFLIFKIISSDTGGPGISYGLFGLEFTNPYLQMRWFLRTHGYHNRPVHKAVEMWFIVSFMIIRIFGGTTLLYYVEIHPDMELSLKIAFIGIYVVSWLLAVQIIQFMQKKYLRGSQPLLSGSVLSIFAYRRRVFAQGRPSPVPRSLPIEAVEGTESIESEN